MSVSSLGSIKANFGISDDNPIQYEKKDNELILHIPLRSAYADNGEIIQKAKSLARHKKQSEKSREDFFNDFLKVREKVMKNVGMYYAKQ